MTLPAYLPSMMVGQSQMSASFDDASRRSGVSVRIESGSFAPTWSERGSDTTARPVQRPGEARSTDGAIERRERLPLPGQQSPGGEAGIAGEAAASATERQTIAVQQLSNIRARSGATDPVELPVPVTQILQIVLAGGSTDIVEANADAGSLYEDVRQMIAPRMAAESPLAA